MKQAENLAGAIAERLWRDYLQPGWRKKRGRRMRPADVAHQHRRDLCKLERLTKDMEK